MLHDDGRSASSNNVPEQDLERPPFPPPALGLRPAFPPALGDALGADLLMAWSFLGTFGEILGLWPCTVEELLGALVGGNASRLLGEVHIALLRLLQADMEEAHALGAVQVHAFAPLVPQKPRALLVLIMLLASIPALLVAEWGSV